MQTKSLTMFLLALAALLLFGTQGNAFAAGFNQSSLSRWLSDETTPEIAALLAEHPRFQGRAVTLQREQDNALAEAIVITVSNSLGSEEGIQLASAAPRPTQAVALPQPIDALVCNGPGHSGPVLHIAATRLANGKGQVTLTLFDDSGTAEAVERWQWLGNYSSAERGAYHDQPANVFVNGDIDAPWREQDLHLAAQGLHQQLSCALRPQVKTQLTLDWQEQPLPAPFADTVQHTRYLVGNYAELSIGESNADYIVRPELVPLQDDRWQLWLQAVPQRSDLPQLEASTYFLAESVVYAVAPKKDRGAAISHLDVRLLDVLQVDKPGARADLQLQLRIANTSPWPIDYAFALSGGHYQHCVPEAAYYRHDRHGYIEGRLAPGQSLTRNMVVEGARHSPNPWFGPRRCAGFRSLAGFEDFASNGRSVTQFVRWATLGG